MKQHANLYRLELETPRPRLAATTIARGLAAAATVMLLAQGVVEWRNHRLAGQVETLRAARASESARVVEMARLYPPPAVDAVLEAETSRLAREREAKQRLLGLLSSESLGNTRGFSEHVSGLARRHVPGVWLRHIEIRAGGGELALEGGSLDPALVPRFLRSLGEEPAFVGSEFHTLRIQRSASAPGQLDWQARTRDPDADGGERR